MEGNTLFPVFLKLQELRTVLVGAGTVGHEKLSALLNNSPQATITVIAEEVSPEVIELASTFPRVKISQKTYDVADLHSASIVIAATNRPHINEQIRRDAMQLNALINVADKPELCDFYLGSIVQKGNLKIAISTNGKSPTIAKRLKEIFNDHLPSELDNTLLQMNHLRNNLQGDFQAKVKKLNEVTSILREPAETVKRNNKLKWMIWLAGVSSLVLLCNTLA